MYKLKISRIYYILSTVLSEPYLFFYRKKIKALLDDDWRHNKSAYQKFQQIHLKKIISAALKTNYYSRLVREKKLPPQPTIHDFPIVDKSDFRENWKDHLASNFLVPHTEKNTGGSTGQPFHFFVSLKNRQFEYIHQTFFYERFGYIRGELIYSFGGTRLTQKDVKKRIFWKKTRKNFPFGAVSFAAIELNEDNSEFYINKILNDRPSILKGYPSAIEFVAREVLKKCLSDQFNFLKGVMLSSENVSRTQIDTIREGFNCDVYPQYGMTESCAFGFTNKNSLEYYCSPYYGYTEVLGKNDKHVGKGEIGELVLTSLGNNYQPFIRYRTGDLAEYGGVVNGFTLLNRIIGRSQDYIVTIDGKKIMLVGLIFGAHSSVFKKIKTWQIIQSQPGEIQVRVQTDTNWDDSAFDELRMIFNCSGKVNVQIELTDNFVLTPAGKRKFVIQQIK